MKALIKAAVMFCPAGKSILKNTSSHDMTTKHMLKQLQGRLDQNLEWYYMLRTQIDTQKIVVEPAGLSSRLSR